MAPNGVNGANGTNGNGNGISGWKHYNEGTFLFTVSHNSRLFSANYPF